MKSNSSSLARQRISQVTNLTILAAPHLGKVENTCKISSPTNFLLVYFRRLAHCSHIVLFRTQMTQQVSCRTISVSCWHMIGMTIFCCCLSIWLCVHISWTVFKLNQGNHRALDSQQTKKCTVPANTSHLQRKSMEKLGHCNSFLIDSSKLWYHSFQVCITPCIISTS